MKIIKIILFKFKDKFKIKCLDIIMEIHLLHLHTLDLIINNQIKIINMIILDNIILILIFN
jgi:hypothetical protein